MAPLGHSGKLISANTMIRPGHRAPGLINCGSPLHSGIGWRPTTGKSRLGIAHEIVFRKFNGAYRIFGPGASVSGCALGVIHA